MSKKHIKLLLAFIVIVVAFFAGKSVFYSDKIDNKANKEETGSIIMGFIGPLSGDVSAYGIGEMRAVQMAVDEINSSGGVLGKNIEVLFEDGKCNGKDAASAAKKLIEVNGVRVIFGGACSGETLAIAPIAEKSKVILFSSYSTNPEISKAGDYVFRNIPSDLETASGIAGLVADDGHDSVAILTEQTDFAMGVRNNLMKSFKEYGIRVVADEKFEQGSRDYRSQISKIKNENPSAIVINTQGGITSGTATKQIRELGINSRLYGGYDAGSQEALDIGGSSMDNMKFVTAPGLRRENTVANRLIESFVSMYGDPVSDYAIGARYDSVYIITNAIEHCGSVDTECIKDRLYDTTYSGAIGNYSFDENGDPVGLRTYSVKRVLDAEKGEVVDI